MILKNAVLSLILTPAASVILAPSAFATGVVYNNPGETTICSPGHVTKRPGHVTDVPGTFVCGTSVSAEDIANLPECSAQSGTALQVDLKPLGKPIFDGPGGGKPTNTPESEDIIVQNIDWRVVGSPACLLNIVNPDQNPPPQPGTPGGPVSWPPAKPDVESIGTSI